MNTPDEPETTAVAVREATGLPVMNAALVTQTMEALKTIRQFVAKELVEGTDYGTIPGAGDKKVMLLPGAQKVNMLYNCYPEYVVEEKDLGGGHAEFRVGTRLIHRGTGSVIGAGVGSCSTMESKYRWRTASRVCPKCEKDTIKRSKYPDRDAPDDPPGWYCFGKIGGCGANFRHDDPTITGQQTGRAENPDIADQRNTVLKMAKKRSLVDASIGLGCLTELFTQDFGDEEHEAPEEPKQPAKSPAKPAGQSSPPPPATRPAEKWTVPTLAARVAGRTPPNSAAELTTWLKWLVPELRKLVPDFAENDLRQMVENEIVDLPDNWTVDKLDPGQAKGAWQAVSMWLQGEAGRLAAAAA